MEAQTMRSPRRAPSGRQQVLRHGDQEVVVVSVGGGIREYRAGTVALLDGYGADDMADGARGQLLVPWPNRIRDGRYAWEGEEQRLALTEPAASHAIHGLARWTEWNVEPLGESGAWLTLSLPPQPGYPSRWTSPSSISSTTRGSASRST
jgi:aldose 1-epimerase